MASRAELELRARGVGVDPASYPNDSKLEQKVLYEEKRGTQAVGTKATGTLTSTGVAPANNETVTIGATVYTLKTTLTGAAFEVLIGASAATALANLKSAINATAGSGTTYGTGTTVHPTATATTLTATTLVVDALEPGTAGNAIATTETSTVLSWGAATLAGAAANETSDTTRGGISGDANV